MGLPCLRVDPVPAMSGATSVAAVRTGRHSSKHSGTASARSDKAVLLFNALAYSRMGVRLWRCLGRPARMCCGDTAASYPWAGVGLSASRFRAGHLLAHQLLPSPQGPAYLELPFAALASIVGDGALSLDSRERTSSVPRRPIPAGLSQLFAHARAKPAGGLFGDGDCASGRWRSRLSLTAFVRRQSQLGTRLIGLVHRLVVTAW